MIAHRLLLAGCWFIELTRHQDERGWFCEAFKEQELLAQTGRHFAVDQINVSLSHAGVIRGVHYSAARPGQAKYVQCLQGSIRDVVIDLRQGSETFGQHDSIFLSEESPTAVLLAEGVGHAFEVMNGPALLAYATTSKYDPASERTINPLDPELGLPWAFGRAPILSERDRGAPSLREATQAGLLPAVGPRSD